MKTTSTFLVMPTDLNPFGNLFGGTMMSWMDKVAVLCAMEHTGRNCVTLFVDQIKFVSPVSLMEVVEMEAKIVDEGMTSVLIYVKASKRKTVQAHGELSLVAESIFKFVALDENANPTDKWARRLNDKRKTILNNHIETSINSKVS